MFSEARGVLLYLSCMMKSRSSHKLFPSPPPVTDTSYLELSWQTVYQWQLFNGRRWEPITFIWSVFSLFLKKILCIYFLDGGKGDREGEKHQYVAASCASPTGDLACNPGMCPDWESSRRAFDSQAGTQPLSHTSQGRWISFLLKPFPWWWGGSIIFFILVTPDKQRIWRNKKYLKY